MATAAWCSIEQFRCITREHERHHASVLCMVDVVVSRDVEDVLIMLTSTVGKSVLANYSIIWHARHSGDFISG